MSPVRIAAALAFMMAMAGAANAALKYTHHVAGDGLTVLIVEGEFEFDDDLRLFIEAVTANRPNAITFHSPGGFPPKAMELGRLIRQAQLPTVQAREFFCASACALAFFGGVARFADPGAIGVHKSFFTAEALMNRDDAVSAIQELTADFIRYMGEMGVDPALLEVALRYEADDMRFLSKSEMIRYRVVTTPDSEQPERLATPAPAVAPSMAPTPPPPPAPKIVLDYKAKPVKAQSGRVRHPKGKAPLKFKPDTKAGNLFELSNGAAVKILDNKGRWYRVRSGLLTGYMHHTWVFVDQFDSGPFSDRHIQVKSFAKLAQVEAYVKGSTLPLAAYLVTNGWYAITLERTFDQATALKVVKQLKAEGLVPDDAYMTYGNTYVRRVCCS